MAKLTSITEHCQHFLADLKESFWGDLYGQTKHVWKQFLEAESARERDRVVARESYAGDRIGDSLTCADC